MILTSATLDTVDYKKQTNNMKVGTFFSGVGSPEQALNNLGIDHEIEFACDIDKYAKQTYLKNFNTKQFYTDITALDMKDLSYVDLLVFGFPCQAFSLAGKRGGFEDTRGTLFYDALRYLKEHRPRYFIAENVKGLVSHDKGKTFQTIIDCLASTVNTQMSILPFDNLGYHIHYNVLNTKDFGVPQNRERIFIVGIRDDEDNNFTFPKPFHLENKLKDVLENDVDDKYYLSNQRIKTLQNNPRSIGFTDKNNKHFANCLIASKLPTDGEYILDDLIISHSLYPRSGNPKQGGTGHLSKQDGTSYCLDTGNAQAVEVIQINPALSTIWNESNLINTKKIRRLTPIECERLQGFPDNHTEGVSDTQRYKQMGNTITVNVMMELLKKLLK
jgi:DNA (cytosine-5)-methyltransferase 1